MIPAVGVYLNPQSFDVVRPVSSPGEISQIELDLVPSLVKSHGHCAYERFHSGGRLVIAGTEPPADILVVQNLLEKVVI